MNVEHNGELEQEVTEGTESDKPALLRYLRFLLFNSPLISVTPRMGYFAVTWLMLRRVFLRLSRIS